MKILNSENLIFWTFWSNSQNSVKCGKNNLQFKTENFSVKSNQALIVVESWLHGIFVANIEKPQNPHYCEDYGNLFSDFFDKNFVKMTFLLNQLLKICFDEIFHQWDCILRFSTLWNVEKGKVMQFFRQINIPIYLDSRKCVCILGICFITYCFHEIFFEWYLAKFSFSLWIFVQF